MPRFLPAAALAMCLSVPLATTATAQNETCTVTTQIVATAVTLRAEGTNADTVKRSLTSGNAAVSDKYKGTVAPLVDWVFTLDQAVLADPAAAETISGAYQETCAGYEP